MGIARRCKSITPPAKVTEGLVTDWKSLRITFSSALGLILTTDLPVPLVLKFWPLAMLEKRPLITPLEVSRSRRVDGEHLTQLLLMQPSKNQPASEKGQHPRD
jgi:hypothetical protein